MMDIFFAILVFILVITAVLNGIYGHIYKVVNMPSSPQTRNLIVKDLKKRLQGKDIPMIYDLGSGWGGLVRKVKKSFPEAHVNGYEISPIPYAYSKIIQILDVFRHYTIKRQNIFTVSINKADAIICYLSPYHMARFEDEIVQHMKPGSILYSQGFPLNNREPTSVIHASYSIEKKIYCYNIM